MLDGLFDNFVVCLLCFCNLLVKLFDVVILLGVLFVIYANVLCCLFCFVLFDGCVT